MLKLSSLKTHLDLSISMHYVYTLMATIINTSNGDKDNKSQTSFCHFLGLYHLTPFKAA